MMDWDGDIDGVALVPLVVTMSGGRVDIVGCGALNMADLVFERFNATEQSFLMFFHKTFNQPRSLYSICTCLNDYDINL